MGGYSVSVSGHPLVPVSPSWTNDKGEANKSRIWTNQKSPPHGVRVTLAAEEWRPRNGETQLGQHNSGGRFHIRVRSGLYGVLVYLR